VACKSNVTQTARATIETAISAPGTSWASKRAAKAAGMTPVSRHQDEADRLRTELEAELSKSFWRRLFGA
jgi:hypothetical protein